MSKLNIWPRVVFIDWHGVLCNSEFWYSIPIKQKDNSYLAAANVRDALFQSSSPDLGAWMRGELSTYSIVAAHSRLPAESIPVVTEQLRSRLEQECRRGPINDALVSTLKQWSDRANLVIATDNMDFFCATVWMRPDIRSFADDILSSADLGLLKSDDPNRFFGDYLRRAGLAWGDAILIDDSADNCSRFESFGGHSIHISKFSNAAETVSRSLSRYF